MDNFTAEDMKQMVEAQHLLNSMEEIGPERRRELMAIVRALAELARENSVAREYLERRLVGVACSLPSEVETFRACYLVGHRRESARQIGKLLHIDKSTVNRHNRRVMEALFVYMFGIYGVFQEKADQECKP